MRSARAAARRDLPIPGSPEISTICPSPFQASRWRSSRKSISSSRPMRSLRPAARTASKRLSEADTPSTIHAATGSAIPLNSCPPRSRGGSDDDRPGLGQGLKAGCKVRRLPDNSVLPQRTLTDHHHAGRDANANRERFGGARLESRNCGDDLEPRPHGSLGIVFVRDWIAEIGQYPVAPELSEEAVIGSRNTGAGGVIGIDHDAHVLRIESGRQSSRAHQIADHHGEVTALELVTRHRFGPRRKLGRCGRGSAKLGNRLEQSPAISKKYDAKLLLEILVGEVLKDRKIDPVLGKPVRILGESERSEPLSERWHCLTRPPARGSLCKSSRLPPCPQVPTGSMRRR